MLLIVMETRPPPLQVEETAKEVPALHELADPLEGVGVTPPFEEVEVDVEGAEEDELEELEVDEEDEDELDEEEALEEELELEDAVALEVDPALQLPWVAHWHWAASEQEGEPPPPQGTWR